MTDEKGSLEQRTQNQVPSKLSGNCPVCKEDTTFNYQGHVTSLRRTKSLEIYNCEKCEGTFTLNGLTDKYGTKFEPEDLIDAHSAKKSLLNSLKKTLIRAIYSI